MQECTEEYLNKKLMDPPHRTKDEKKSKIIACIILTFINKHGNRNYSKEDQQNFKKDCKESCIKSKNKVKFSTINSKPCLYPWDKNFHIEDIWDLYENKTNTNTIYYKYTKNPKNRNINDKIKNYKDPNTSLKKRTIKEPFLIACIDCNAEWYSKNEHDNLCPKCQSTNTIHNDMKQFGCNGEGSCIINSKKKEVKK